MFLPNAPALEVEMKAAKRLKAIHFETPKDFEPFGVLYYLVV